MLLLIARGQCPSGDVGGLHSGDYNPCNNQNECCVCVCVWDYIYRKITN